MADKELEQALALAERAVAHWDEALSEAIRQAQALDGWMGWFSKWVGRHEADVDAAVAQVAAARDRLAGAVAQRDAARAAIVARAAEAVVADEQALAEQLAVEQAAVAVRAEPGPRGDALRALEGSLEAAEGRVVSLARALEAGDDFLHALSSTRMGIRRLLEKEERPTWQEVHTHADPMNDAFDLAGAVASEVSRPWGRAVADASALVEHARCFAATVAEFGLDDERWWTESHQVAEQVNRAPRETELVLLGLLGSVQPARDGIAALLEAERGEVARLRGARAALVRPS